MIEVSETPPSGAWLLVEEISHRVANEYAMAVAALSVAARQTSSREVKATLAGAARRLRDFANLHRSLQPPASPGQINLQAYVGDLCDSFSRARLNDRDVGLTIAGRDVFVSAERGWRVGLIVMELVTNAVRHAFPEGKGAVSVTLDSVGGNVHCIVSDDGTAAPNAAPGRGTRIVNALAEQLDGLVWREFGNHGTTVSLYFPE
ncbi:MAG: sensor histidine kinase [Rhizomicrobium sp.]